MGIVKDIRFAIRVLIKDRWFTALALVALSLGIGLNNTVFTLVNAVILRGLPYEEPDRIMHLSAQNLSEGRKFLVSYPDFEDWQAASVSFTGLAAYRRGTIIINDEGHAPERAWGDWISADTFGLIGQRPLMGRDFAKDEDQPDAEPVTILGYGLWMRRYGGDSDLVGQVIRVNEVPTTVIGVMPEGVQFPRNVELWLPLTGGTNRPKRDHRDLQLFGRLGGGVSLEEARAEMSAIASQLAEQYPDTNRGVDAVVVPFNDRYNGGDIKIAFLALMVVVGLVLLIACANVASLLLARSAYRAREIAVRTAVRASRWQIVRQLLVESILMGLVSGAMGFVLSVAGVRLFARAVADVGRPYWVEFTMDWPVFTFLLAVTLGTGFVFGLAPALQISRLDVNKNLQAGGRGGGAGLRARRSTRAMVVVQLSLTVALLFGAGLMMRSFLNLYNAELGVRTHDVLRLSLELAERKYPEPADRYAFHERLRERLAGYRD